VPHATLMCPPRAARAAGLSHGSQLTVAMPGFLGWRAGVPPGSLALQVFVVRSSISVDELSVGLLPAPPSAEDEFQRPAFLDVRCHFQDRSAKASGDVFEVLVSRLEGGREHGLVAHEPVRRRLGRIRKKTLP
jgi:hypothetical protein